MGGGGGERRGLQKGKGREVWEKGLIFFASSLLNLHATVLYKTYKMEEAKCNNYNKHLNYCYAMEVRGRGFYPPPPPLPIVVC